MTARFVTFVDGSNLYGVLRRLDIEVRDYEALYSYIFERAYQQWKCTWTGAVPAAQHKRVFWHVVGDLDEWRLEEPQAQQYLRGQFDSDRLLTRAWMPEAGKALAERGVKDGAQVADLAFSMWFAEFRGWYESKARALDGMHRFYHSVESSTEFIEFKRSGRWKVNPRTQTVDEKGLDTSLAIDFVSQTDNFDVALLVSGDADFIPALRLAKLRGKQVGVVEFIAGYPPEKRGKNFATRLKVASDFVVQVYESDLVRYNIARKRVILPPA